MTAGLLCFVEVVPLISWVHGISLVFSSVGFRRDVRTKIAFTKGIRSNLWISSWHVACRQRPLKKKNNVLLDIIKYPQFEHGILE